MGAQGTRAAGIMRTSIVGIAANAALVCVKLIIGNLTHSVAIVSDGSIDREDLAEQFAAELEQQFPSRRFLVTTESYIAD